MERLIPRSRFYQIRSKLPTRYRLLNPNLIYLLSTNGSSFTVFNSALLNEGNKPLFLIIFQTSHRTLGVIFSIKPKQCSNRYFGDNSTCVIDFDQEKVYLPTSQTTLNISMQSDCFFIGKRKAAIFVNNELKKVYSDDCEAFGSPSFTGESGDSIIDIGIYIMQH